ncbi:hypothetical protein SKM52_03495 [Acinetobacter faecalis]|uniref:hypothetical protein n=1 Tax=Acinetobacter faecalis TaxID=2665161 RepID=UPI002A91BAFE|nr:hypothetical protein [Acinetobacter faecalis]MDY6523613.1 hypothetical protein [Acinetobacter faecalis]
MSAFYLMVEQLKIHKLILEDQVLIYLSCWREYLALFHVATLSDVLKRLPTQKMSQIEELLRHEWKTDPN